MPNKNHSKSDKKTRKYKQRRAQLLAEAAQLKKETEKLNKEGAEQSKKTDKKFEEVGEKFEEVGEKIKEVSEQQKETEKKVKEVAESVRQVRIGIEYHGEQIGGLGNKLGGYTEAMAMPSIRGILNLHFDADFKGSNLVRNTNNGLDMEVDAWGVRPQRHRCGLPGGDQEQVSRRAHQTDLADSEAVSGQSAGISGAGRVSDAGGGGHQRCGSRDGVECGDSSDRDQ